MSDGFVRQSAADLDKKIDAERLLVGGVEVFRLRTTSGPMAVVVDKVSPTEVFVGEASPGSSPTANVWRIRKVLTLGTETRILFAEGSVNFAFRWADRASLTYV